MQDILTIKDLRKDFDGLGVLSGISLSVKKGEVVSIIGSSGSGKSTLLRCATMLERISGGSICYKGDMMAWEDENGKVVYASKDKLAKIRSCFGLVFQNFNLFPHMTVLKNITAAPISVMKMPKEQAESEAMSLLAKMGLEAKAGEYPSPGFPADNSSVYRSRAHLYASLRYCSLTSRLRRLIRSSLREFSK